MSKARMKNKRGVTLIELIVVIFIVALGAGFVAPNIGGWLPSYRLRTATRDVASAMRTGQIQAVSTNSRWRVSFPVNNRGERCILLEQDPNMNGNWVSDPKWIDGTGQPFKSFPSQIVLNSTFQAVNGAPGGGVFNPNATSSAGSVTLTNSKGSVKRIAVAPSTGRIKIDY